MKELKILAIVDKNSKYIEQGIEKLSKSFRGTVYLAYVKDVSFYPAEVLLEFEKSFDKIREEGLEILNKIAKNIKELGFEVEILGVHCGVATERILKLKEMLNPDIIIVEHKCGFRRLLSEDYVSSLVCDLKVPVMVVG